MAVDADAADFTLDRSGCEPACEDEDGEDVETLCDKTFRVAESAEDHNPYCRALAATAG